MTVVGGVCLAPFPKGLIPFREPFNKKLYHIYLIFAIGVDFSGKLWYNEIVLGGAIMDYYEGDDYYKPVNQRQGYTSSLLRVCVDKNRVLAAAKKLKDGTILIGKKHNKIQTPYAIPFEEGFVNREGFLSRLEALQIAVAKDQLNRYGVVYLEKIPDATEFLVGETHIKYADPEIRKKLFLSSEMINITDDDIEIAQDIAYQINLETVGKKLAEKRQKLNMTPKKFIKSLSKANNGTKKNGIKRRIPHHHR